MECSLNATELYRVAVTTSDNITRDVGVIRKPRIAIDPRLLIHLGYDLLHEGLLLLFVSITVELIRFISNDFHSLDD